ncbi:MAG TPA: acetolactate synthase small subunit [Firmicutes bacterium]|nr:acetolactate synthase small subunit [Bacillota bacterium]
MRHTLAVLVMNHPGVLARVSGLFARRGFNIESIAVGTTQNKEVSRMTIVVEADENTLEQITKQLNKLIDVIKVQELRPEDSVDRELALVKISAAGADRAQVLQIVDIFRASIVDVSRKAVVAEVTGSEDKIDAFIELVRPYGIKELVRTGRIAMVRGEQQTVATGETRNNGCDDCRDERHGYERRNGRYNDCETPDLGKIRTMKARAGN